MKTRRAVVSLLAGALAVMVIGWGCNKQNTANGTSQSSDNAGGQGLAIVNYENVLRDLGWRTKFETDVKAAGEKLSKDFQEAQQRYNSQLGEVQKILDKEGNKPTPQQQQQLNQLVMNMRQTVYQLQQRANERLSAYQVEWNRRYRDALAPITRQVAQQKKFNVVIAQNDGVVFVEPSVDITNAVVDAAKAQPPSLIDVPLPSLDAPPGISIVQNPTSGPTTGPATMPTTHP